MTKTFFIVWMKDDPVLMSTLSYDGEYYNYKPYNLDTCKIPRYEKEFKSKYPPHMLERRTYSEGRPDIAELLAKMGLEKYDLWKMVEIYEGKIATDSIRYLTLEGLKKYGFEYMLDQIE